MEKVVWIISYKLKKGVSQDDFIASTKLLHDGIISKAKGFISWEQYKDNDTWTDFVTWETLEDANNGESVGKDSELANKFYSYILMTSCRMLTSKFIIAY